MASGPTHLGGFDLVSEIKAWYQSQALWEGEMLQEEGIEPGIAAYLPRTLPGAGNLSEEQGILDCNKWSKKG